MAVSKVVLNGVVLIDVTDDTVDASSLLSGVTATGADGMEITGTYTPPVPSLQAKTNIAPTTASQTITADSGYDGLSSVQINAMPSGTAGTPSITQILGTNSVRVVPSVTNATGYITGGTKTGTAETIKASDLVSGTYSVTSSGTADVTNYASVDVPSGAEGTPSATKGTVSNHSISVTPSVTNTAGYIAGGTKTGTAVTVSASELVSGSLEITENGTADVTNYASVDVNVSGGGGTNQLYVFTQVGYVNTDVVMANQNVSPMTAYQDSLIVAGATVTFKSYQDYIIDYIEGWESGNTISYTTVTRGQYTFTMPNESVYVHLLYDD